MRGVIGINYSQAIFNDINTRIRVWPVNYSDSTFVTG